MVISKEQGDNPMSIKRYLTKSRFKLATECPTKLFYTGKCNYANQNLDDSSLLALADGGFQVGNLAKSFDPMEENPFTNKNGTIKSDWKSYLYDVAFQKYVINQALPQYEVSAHLMMADKTATCPTDGLNQKFRLVKDPDGTDRTAGHGQLDQGLHHGDH
jgi:hypothetical protein